MFEENDVHLRIRTAVCSTAAAVVPSRVRRILRPHPEKFVVMSDEASAAQFGAGRARSHKIGTITAYCERVARNKCPTAVNET